MMRRLVRAVGLLTACGSSQAPTAAPAPQRCDSQWVAVVANRSRAAVDVFDSRGVLGSVDPGQDGEFVLTPPTTRVQFRASSGATGLRADQVNVRYVCR